MTRKEFNEQTTTIKADRDKYSQALQWLNGNKPSHIVRVDNKLDYHQYTTEPLERYQLIWFLSANPLLVMRSTATKQLEVFTESDLYAMQKWPCDFASFLLEKLRAAWVMEDSVRVAS